MFLIFCGNEFWSAVDIGAFIISGYFCKLFVKILPKIRLKFQTYLWQISCRYQSNLSHISGQSQANLRHILEKVWANLRYHAVLHICLQSSNLSITLVVQTYTCHINSLLLFFGQIFVCYFYMPLDCTSMYDPRTSYKTIENDLHFNISIRQYFTISNNICSYHTISIKYSWDILNTLWKYLMIENRLHHIISIRQYLIIFRFFWKYLAIFGFEEIFETFLYSSLKNVLRHFNIDLLHRNARKL